MGKKVKDLLKGKLTGRVDPDVLGDDVVEGAGPPDSAGTVRGSRDDASDRQVCFFNVFFF